ncbi:hypothetical protein [Actinopolymorpha sp. B9G3]|uniref:hypothetical protein n=1 Tax=Actinopolymorpha sp. B9G3 TaxID=3158970 RepID=UPI0032D8C41C
MPVTVVTMSLPTYDLTAPPDAEAVGAALDDVICKNFGQDGEREIAIRSVSLIDHPTHTHDSLGEVIRATGTDRYDPERKGPLHEAYDRYGVELHVVPCVVSATSLSSAMCDGRTFYGTTESVMAEAVSDFYVGPPVDRDGVPLRIDLLTIYDLAHLEGIPIPFHGEETPPLSACRFRHPDRRSEAVLGLIKVL